MKLRVHRIDFHRIDMQTRFPFRYGIASMSQLPHLVVSADVAIDGRHCSGFAADGLPPKWFTKNPTTQFEEDDLPAMLRVIRQAADLSVDLAPQRSLFAWWWELYQSQQAWAAQQKIPSLLAGFGTSLIERAVIDAVCRELQITLFEALRTNAFEIDLAVIRPSLGSCQPADIIPDQPLESVLLRHTVGLGDPLSDGEIVDEVDDGLPHSLVANIREYGLTYFKIKLSGDARIDCDRMSDLATILDTEVGSDMRFTLDGNEQYDDVAAFRQCWQRLRSIRQVERMIDQSLLFVEQPLHRSNALDPLVKDGLRAWPEAPPIIIDESDADLGSLPTALELGYSGTSHKNCKGIFKSVAAAATIAIESTPTSPLILSAEDLANMGPIALLQDLAMVSALGIGHVERNGHHYFAGLSMFADPLQERLVADHGDLYGWNDRGFAALAPSAGRLSLSSINRAPFGLAHPPDLSHFQPWSF
jgi:hypothetical protein